MTDLTSRLSDHCRALAWTFAAFDTWIVYGGFDNIFAEFHTGVSPPRVRLRMPGTGRWEWADVPLDGSVPELDVIRLLDRSYALAVGGLDNHARYCLEVASRRPSPLVLLAELIERSRLDHRRERIEALARPTLFIRTRAADETRIPIGGSKLGGCPDLPAGVAWPCYRTGRPLTFLAQFDLAETARAGLRAELPPTGLLSVFSAYGWQSEGDDRAWESVVAEPDWTRVLYHAGPDGLRRQVPPAGTKPYRPAAAELVPHLSLPGHRREPAMRGVLATEAEAERYDDLTSTYAIISGQLLGRPPQTQLLGYANYMQQFEDVVAAEGLRLLLQLDSDDNSAMMWGTAGICTSGSNRRTCDGATFRAW